MLLYHYFLWNTSGTQKASVEHTLKALPSSCLTACGTRLILPFQNAPRFRNGGRSASTTLPAGECIKNRKKTPPAAEYAAAPRRPVKCLGALQQEKKQILSQKQVNVTGRVTIQGGPGWTGQVWESVISTPITGKPEGAFRSLTRSKPNRNGPPPPAMTTAASVRRQRLEVVVGICDFHGGLQLRLRQGRRDNAVSSVFSSRSTTTVSPASRSS